MFAFRNQAGSIGCPLHDSVRRTLTYQSDRKSTGKDRGGSRQRLDTEGKTWGFGSKGGGRDWRFEWDVRKKSQVGRLLFGQTSNHIRGEKNLESTGK